MRYQVWVTDVDDGTSMVAETDNPNDAASVIRRHLDTTRPVTCYVRDTHQSLRSIGAGDRVSLTPSGLAALR